MSHRELIADILIEGLARIDRSSPIKDIFEDSDKENRMGYDTSWTISSWQAETYLSSGKLYIKRSGSATESAQIFHDRSLLLLDT